MYSFLDREGQISLRFSKEDQALMFKVPGSGSSIQHGSVMNGYALVSIDKMKDEEFLKLHLQKSWIFVQALKPKSANKK